MSCTKQLINRFFVISSFTQSSNVFFDLHLPSEYIRICSYSMTFALHNESLDNRSFYHCIIPGYHTDIIG